ncbi:MAG: hypothetical protein P4L53_16025 [Candidatus Obscuribacterales bacterium]|nr:hypothetical protein [Candidatus Obscuribacterales bacterium]
MDFWWSKTGESKVGITDAENFRSEICKLAPSEQVKLLQNINGADKNASVKLDPQGNIQFPGQFTIGSVGGTASDNHYNLGSADASKKISILDSHNNRTNVYCGDPIVPAPNESANHQSDSTFSDEQMDAALKKAGIDPKTFQPISRATESTQTTSAPSMETKIDLELPNHSHVIINQQNGKPPRVSSPEGVAVTNANDGGLDIKFGGGTIHEKNGSVTSNGTIDGIKIIVSNVPDSDKP